MKRGLTIAACVVATGATAGHELDNRDVINGQALYSQHCASCHGSNLEGQAAWQTPGENGVLPAPPHNETGHTWHHDNQLLFEYTRLGGKDALAARGVTGFASGMPGFTDVLSEDSVWDVLAYIQSTWPESIRDIQASRNPPHD